MLRFYFDEHLDLVIASQLRLRGVDAVTAREVGRANQKITDQEQLAYAVSEGRVMVSKDRDFVTLAYVQVPHEGVILLQKPLPVGDTIEYLEFMAKGTEPYEIRNQLVYCDW